MIKYYFVGCKKKTWSCENVSLIEIINGCSWAFEIANESFINNHKYKLLFDVHYMLTITKISTMSKLEDLLTRRSRSQWPRGLRRRSFAARLLRLWVRKPPGAWIFVCCGCCVLSGRGLCDGLIIRSEESYRMWRVVVCDQETS